MSYLDRVVVLVDMDCFYCQVEENLDPRLHGKPIAVVQYNAWRGGGIIAVNYPARDCGVTRHMRGNEAKEKCPSIQLVRVPNVRGKADLTKYREAGKKVAEVLQSFTTLLERASVDEAYLDMTESVINRMKYVDRIHPDQLKNTHVVGHDSVDSYLSAIYSNELMNESNIKLAWGGVIAEEIRAAVLEITGYKCSAGVAHNKILAKLVAGLHKPNQQTVLPHASVPVLFENMPVRKIRSLGGKFGNHLSEKLGIQNMGELYKYSEKELASHFDEKTASWLYNIARGIDNDPVTVRLVSKSIGCCKKFPGRTALTNHEAVKHWLNELSIEISERLEKDLEENNRRARQMIVNFANEVNKKDLSGSRSHPLNSYDANRIMSDAYEVIKKNCLRPDDSFCVKFLGISVGKFEDVKNVSTIALFFNKSRKDNENQIFNSDDGGGSFSKDGENVSSGCSKNKTKINNRNSIASFFMNYTNKISKEGNNINAATISNENIDEKVMQTVENRHIMGLNDGMEFGENNNGEQTNCSFMSKSNLELITNNAEHNLINNKNTQSRNKTDDISKTCDDTDKTITDGNKNNYIEENSDDSNDSITQEFQESSNIHNTSSFFNKYMEKLQHPAERNFNTSLVLDQENFDTGIDEILDDEVASSQQVLNRISNDISPTSTEETANTTNDPSFESNQELNPPTTVANFDNQILDESNQELNPVSLDDGCEVCPECSKRIPKIEFISHMDYHFALKIVRDEADLYRPVKVEKPATPKKNMKRKASNPEKCMKLTSFLVSRTDDDEDVPKEICSECNKSIPIEDLASHVDYHLAKRIHLELNNFNNKVAVKKCDTKTKLKKCDSKSSGKVSGKKEGGCSIATFFKPL